MLRVLIADDQPLNRRLMQAVLEPRGHSLVAAGNGREVVAALEREAFDLVLMDLEMEELDGIEATAAIRARERSTGGHVPIVAITAHSFEEAGGRCLAAGMDGYLCKPIHPRELIELVERLTAAGPGPADEEVRLLQEAKQAAADLVPRFVADARRLQAEIRDAIARRDAGTLERAAHLLRGAAGYFARGRILDLARRLEELGKASDCGSAAEEACRELGTEVARLDRLPDAGGQPG